MRTLIATALTFTLLGPAPALAQSGASPAQRPQPATPAKTPAVVGASRPIEAGYTIGPEDVLGVLFWKDQDMSSDVTVRPDGMITVPLIRDIKAAGLAPNELADRIQAAARELVTDASVTVVVRQVNSRKVFITGEVARPGSYPLVSSMTVMQVIAVAGGLTEFADVRGIIVTRVENGVTRTLLFDYKEFSKGRKAELNIALKPGDTVVVPER